MRKGKIYGMSKGWDEGQRKVLMYAGDDARGYVDGMLVNNRYGWYRVTNTRPIAGVPFVSMRKLGSVELYLRRLYWRVVTGIGGWT